MRMNIEKIYFKEDIKNEVKKIPVEKIKEYFYVAGRRMKERDIPAPYFFILKNWALKK